jgi:hypothetical protein
MVRAKGSEPVAAPGGAVFGILRALCLVTAIANAGGNVLMLFFYRPVLELVGAPLPRDLHSFAFVCGFSFTVGVLALLVYLDPRRSRSLIVIAIIGKGIYAALTAYFYFDHDLHWFYKLFGIWDGAYVVILLLFLIHLNSPDLAALNAGQIRPGLPGPRPRKALLVFYSLTGNGTRALARVKTGLERNGYTVTEQRVEAAEADAALFRFPFGGLGKFLRIMFRAIFRVPAKAKPLGIPADHDYDLIVAECQTWFLGMGGPMEGVFQDPANHGVFAGRDVAAVVVCRGLWRRTEAMLVRWLQRAGGNVVGAASFTNPGREPMRTFSLFFFLGTGAPRRPAWLARLLTPQYLEEAALQALDAFGEALAQRPVAAHREAA